MDPRRILRDTATVAASATLVAAALVAALWSDPVVADDERTAVVTIEAPTLTAAGCELTVVPTKESLVAGDRFLATLRAKNPGTTAVRLPVHVALQVRPPAPMMARMVPMPTTEWEYEGELALAPGESREVALAPKTKLGAGVFAFYTVTVGDETLRLLSASLPHPDAGGPVDLIAGPARPRRAQLPDRPEPSVEAAVGRANRNPAPSAPSKGTRGRQAQLVQQGTAD